MFRRKPTQAPPAPAHPPVVPARAPAATAHGPTAATYPQLSSEPILDRDVFSDTMKSIEYAQRMMEKNQASLRKVQANQESRNKIISKASEVVNALLDPALQVANLLDGVGGFFPPCKAVSSTLQTIVEIEQNRRDNDVRIVVVIMDISILLATLGSLKPGFQNVQSLTGPLGKIISRVDSLLKKFGEFSERFYQGSASVARLRHLLHSSSNKSEIADFRQEVGMIKADLTYLLSHQAVLILAENSENLARIEKHLQPVTRFYASLTSGDEVEAEAFVHEHGGEDVVKSDDSLLEAFAQKMGEVLNPNIVSIIKESTEEAIRQSHASFMLKFQFALDMKLDESQEEILKEIREGPHERIKDADLKNIWKEISGKESSIKRRRFIDGFSYYFNRQFKTYSLQHNRAEQRDAWTRQIINKVHYHSAICDAIDDDASGYISVGEIIEFIRDKPAHWTIPEWVAYWAYGWDADNIEYGAIIGQIFGKLYAIRDSGGENADAVSAYLSAVENSLTAITHSVYVLNTLNASIEPKMDRLREEWCAHIETLIKRRLKTLNYRFDETNFSSITGTQRVEATFFPFAYLLLSRHLAMFEKPGVKEEAAGEATQSIRVLLDVADSRIRELKAIWRRQRIDVEVQVRYYANGFFEDYYKAFLSDDLDRQSKPSPGEWDDDDAWESEEEGQEVDPDGLPPNQVDEEHGPEESVAEGQEEGVHAYSHENDAEEDGSYAQDPVEPQDDDEVEDSQGQDREDEDEDVGVQQQYARRYASDDEEDGNEQAYEDQYARDQARRGGRNRYNNYANEEE